MHSISHRYVYKKFDNTLFFWPMVKKSANKATKPLFRPRNFAHRIRVPFRQPVWAALRDSQFITLWTWHSCSWCCVQLHCPSHWMMQETSDSQRENGPTARIRHQTRETQFRPLWHITWIHSVLRGETAKTDSGNHLGRDWLSGPTINSGRPIVGRSLHWAASNRSIVQKASILERSRSEIALIMSNDMSMWGLRGADQFDHFLYILLVELDVSSRERPSLQISFTASKKPERVIVSEDKNVLHWLSSLRFPFLAMLVSHIDLKKTILSIRLSWQSRTRVNGTITAFILQQKLWSLKLQ